jgi:hypothetical protein
MLWACLPAQRYSKARHCSGPDQNAPAAAEVAAKPRLPNGIGRNREARRGTVEAPQECAYLEQRVVVGPRVWMNELTFDERNRLAPLLIESRPHNLRGTREAGLFKVAQQRSTASVVAGR